MASTLGPKHLNKPFKKFRPQGVVLGRTGPRICRRGTTWYCADTTALQCLLWRKIANPVSPSGFLGSNPSGGVTTPKKKMKKTLFLLAFLLLTTPFVLAQQETSDVFARQTVTSQINLSSFVILEPKKAFEDYSFEYVKAGLRFFPREELSQKVFRITTTPKAKQEQDRIVFRWDKPLQERLDYGIESVVSVQNNFPKVRQKIRFPLTGLPEETKQYLKPTEHVDITPSILSQANALAQGEDDLWVVVSKIAIWTKNNINYNLSTLTADVSQKASWVLKNRFGVCDELTSLFIAMLRSIGIPAKFVSGVAYTTSPLFEQNWGAHGWAEVYFPQHGWIPFDPTFGEFGWIDPGHVKMLESLDPEEPSTLFEWRGTNAKLDVKELDIRATIKELGQRISPHAKLTIQPLYDNVGFGSHNLVLAEVENLNDYYTTLMVSLARVRELEILDELNKELILKPFEKKRLLWRVRVKQDLKKEYLYTIPLGISTIWNETALSSFKATAKGEQHSRAEITRTMNALEGEEKKVFAKHLELECMAEPVELHEEQKARITCWVNNQGTVPFPNLLVCLENQCETTSVGIGQTKTISFVQEYTEPGTRTFAITAKTVGVTRTSLVTLRMLDKPDVKIKKVVSPTTIRWGLPVSISFVAEPVSLATPQHVTISVGKDQRLFPAFTVDELHTAQPFEIELSSKDLSPGMNTLIIKAEFEDVEGNNYATTASTTITVTNVPWYMKPLIWLRDLFG